MYKKLLKNFLTKNIKVFLLIFISLSISIFGYTFSDSLSNNFLDNIEKDSRASLGGDFLIDIGNRDKSIIDDFIKDFEYKDKVLFAKEFSFRSSIKTKEITPANIVFFSENYPFYFDFEYKELNPNGDIFISEELNANLNKDEKIEILGEKVDVKGVYSGNIGTINPFFGTENVLISIDKLEDFVANDKNSIIEKKLFIKLKDEKDFSLINNQLKNSSKLNKLRVLNYKEGGDRFKEIISNLRDFINYIVLFSFFLTITIIFLSVSSFFIQERKDISIIRVLGMRNSQFIIFYFILFFSVFFISFLLALFVSKIGYLILGNFELTKDFSLSLISISKGFLIGLSIMIFSVVLPIIKFLDSRANSGFSENFYSNISKKEIVILILLFLIVSNSLSLFLGYEIIKGLIVSLAILFFIIIFYLVGKLILSLVYRNIKKIRGKNFFLYDAVRQTIKPGNMSLLINLNFFIVFFIGLFSLILFGNFYDRLKINLDTDNNFFVLNLDKESYEKLDKNYKDQTYSILRGRIKSINGVSLNDYLGDNVSGRFTREFNITDNKLSDLKLLSGKELKEGGVSVDYNFSNDLGIGLGDKIVFQIFGLEKELEIINIRESRDYSINPFFYFQVDKKEFEKFPKTYFLSSYVEKEKKEEIKNYFYEISSGTSTFIEVDKILEELKSISRKVLIVIKSLFIYISFFSVLSIVVVGLFFRNFQKSNNRLYFLLGTTKKQNNIKTFYSYAYLTSLMFILSLVISSMASYLILSGNSFINFSVKVYLYSVLYIILFYIIMILSIWLFIRKS